MSVLVGPDGRPFPEPIVKANLDRALTTGSLPTGAVGQSDMSGLAQALGDGLSVTAALGPGIPIGPAHQEERGPRWFDYVPGTNVSISPRQGESYTFDTLYNLANTWDVAGIAIEKRKDEFLKLEPMIRPRPVPGQTQKQAQERQAALREQISDATGFLETPDQQNTYPSWLGRYLDDLFKGDCATWYLRGTVGGGLAAVEVPDGTTFKPILDLWGRIAQVPPGTPRHQHEWQRRDPGYGLQSAMGVGMACLICGAAPAYAQIIKGMPWTWYGSDELIYQPRWLRGKGPYGHPPAEGIILSINRALRRQSLDLAWYTEGTLPAAFMKFPTEWTVDQAKDFMAVIDELYAGNDALRSRIIPIPGGPNSGVDRVMPQPVVEMEEYLLHIGCAMYAVSPMELGFIRSSGGAGLGGKGVAEEQKDTGRLRQISLAAHIRRVYNRVLATYWSADLMLFYPSLEERKDQLEEAQTLHQYWEMGATTSDWIAENVLQQDPPGLGAVIVTSQGAVVPVSQITSGEAMPTPIAPPTPSSQPGVNTQAAVTKALGGKAVEYGGDLAKRVYEYLLRSYPPDAAKWVLDPAIRWEYDPGVALDTINFARRPGGRDPDKVEAVQATLEAGASMDPVVLADFGEPKLRVADGFHRLMGAEKAGEPKVPAFVGRDVPAEYRSLVMGAMQDTSHQPATDVRKAAEDLRRWRQKAIGALRRGESAAVPFESDAIPPSARELVAKGLASVTSIDDVWALFGERAPEERRDDEVRKERATTTLPAITLEPSITLPPANVDVHVPAAQPQIDVHVPAAPAQLAPVVNVPAQPAPIVKVAIDMEPFAKELRAGFAHLEASLTAPRRKTVVRDPRTGDIVSTTDELVP